MNNSRQEKKCDHLRLIVNSNNNNDDDDEKKDWSTQGEFIGFSFIHSMFWSSSSRWSLVCVYFAYGDNYYRKTQWKFLTVLYNW